MTLFAASLLFCLLCSLLSSSWAEVPEAKPEARREAKSRCPVGTYSYNDGLAWYCYEYYEYSLPFEDAEAICQQNRNGGHLASITSETQMRLIGGYLSQVTRGQAAEVWIGLRRHKNSDMYRGWQWIDGTYFRYTSWLGGTPNNIGGKQLCVLLTRGSGFKSWDGGTCGYGRPFLCKWRAPWSPCSRCVGNLRACLEARRARWLEDSSPGTLTKPFLPSPPSQKHLSLQLGLNLEGLYFLAALEFSFSCPSGLANKLFWKPPVLRGLSFSSRRGESCRFSEPHGLG